jgi:hypothetical protein
MKKFFLLLPLLFPLLFVYLFKGQQAGVNVLIFNVIIIVILVWSGRLQRTNRLQLLLAAGAMVSSLAVLLYGSVMAMSGNVFSLVLLTGLLASTETRLLVNGFAASAFAAVSAPFNYLLSLNAFTGQRAGGRKLMRFVLIFLIPVIILMVFISIYASASPYFNKLTGGLLEHLADFMTYLSEFIDPSAFWLFVAGLLIIVAFLFGGAWKMLVFFNEGEGMNLIRKKKSFSGRFTTLRYEYRSGVVLLIMLNLVLAVMNVLDIWNVWLFFEWNGDYLKQFVHEGTWMLIFSILISIAIVLYYFRANLNFYPKRKLLLNLAVLWLAQNALLVISVGIRNMWYIHHFNLAYKRIGVYAFLLLTLFGIVTVFFKIRQRKTHQYLFHYNGLATYTILICLGLFNWDKLIAAYNVNHASRAFFHPEFMIRLNSTSLPELEASLKDLDKIQVEQTAKFEFYRNYMPLDDYRERVGERINDFKLGYPQMSWQGWNLAEYQAYRELIRPKPAE